MDDMKLTMIWQRTLEKQLIQHRLDGTELMPQKEGLAILIPKHATTYRKRRKWFIFMVELEEELKQLGVKSLQFYLQDEKRLELCVLEDKRCFLNRKYIKNRENWIKKEVYRQLESRENDD